MILTIVAMHLACLEAKLVEPGMRSFREMFLAPDFFGVRLLLPVLVP